MCTCFFLCILILIKRDKRGLSHLDQNWSRPTSLFLLIIPLPELCLVDASWRWSTDASRHCLSYKPPTVSGSLDYAKNCVTSRHSLPNKPRTSVSNQTPSIHQTSYTPKNMFPMDLWIMQKNCGYLANSQLYLSSRRLRSIGNWYMVQWSNGPQWSSCTAMQRFCPSCHAMVNWSKLEVK